MVSFQDLEGLHETIQAYQRAVGKCADGAEEKATYDNRPRHKNPGTPRA